MASTVVTDHRRRVCNENHQSRERGETKADKTPSIPTPRHLLQGPEHVLIQSIFSLDSYGIQQVPSGFDRFRGRTIEERPAQSWFTTSHRTYPSEGYNRFLTMRGR